MNALTFVGIIVAALVGAAFIAFMNMDAPPLKQEAPATPPARIILIPELGVPCVLTEKGGVSCDWARASLQKPQAETHL